MGCTVDSYLPFSSRCAWNNDLFNIVVAVFESSAIWKVVLTRWRSDHQINIVQKRFCCCALNVGRIVPSDGSPRQLVHGLVTRMNAFKSVSYLPQWLIFCSNVHDISND